MASQLGSVYIGNQNIQIEYPQLRDGKEIQQRFREPEQFSEELFTGKDIEMLNGMSF